MVVTELLKRHNRCRFTQERQINGVSIELAHRNKFIVCLDERSYALLFLVGRVVARVEHARYI
jgi:hypothetical protein